MLTKKEEIKLNQLIVELESGQETKISLALKALQLHGKAMILEVLAKLLLTNLSAKSRGEVIEFMSTLNDSSAIEKMVEIVKDSRFNAIRQELLTTIWNSKLDYSYYVAEFVEIAVDGNFLEALDCLTILENMEGPFQERHLLEAQLHLKDYLEDRAPKDEQKAKIMSEIALLIKDFMLEDDFDLEEFNS
jgi:hypothetical protein